MRRPLALIALIALALVAWSSSAPAQPPPDPTIRVVFRPAAEPRPALKYRLVPEPIKLVPGNAAIFYHRAILLYEQRYRVDSDIKARQSPPGRAVSPDEQVSTWVAGPIADIPIDKARAMVESMRSILGEIEQGASRTTCDWQFDDRPEGISLLLPEIQSMRPLARLVSLQARLAILDGKTDEAMHRIQTGLVMGRHVAKGPTIVQALVGLAIDFVMSKCLEDLIQAPGTPSLYWALADRPRPFIDMRPAYEGERWLLEKELPGIDDLDRSPMSLDEARKFADMLQRKLFSFDGGKTEGSMAHRVGIAAMSAKIYPEARKALLARGRAESEVAAMPVIQVASLYCYQEYRALLDDSFKWHNLPFWQSFDKFDSPFSMTPESKLENPLLAMFRSLTPAFGASRVAALRLDRQLDALQCVEAIRLYAASHGVKLPESLEAITEVPTPLDPTNGKPFGYKLEGDSAILSAPIPPGFPGGKSWMIRYVLTPIR